MKGLAASTLSEPDWTVGLFLTTDLSFSRAPCPHLSHTKWLNVHENFVKLDPEFNLCIGEE